MEEKKSSSTLRNRLIGAGLISVKVIGGVTQANILQAISRGEHAQVPYFRPFFLSYLMHAFYVVLLPVWLLVNYLLWRRNMKRGGKNLARQRLWRVTMPTIWWTGLFSVIGGASSIFWYNALRLAPISANTSIANSAPIMVFLLSALLLGEKVTPWKVAAVVGVFSGVVIVSFFGGKPVNVVDPDPDAPPGWIGMLCALGATACSALYNTLYSRKIRRSKVNKGPDGALLILGLVGIWTLLTHWPIFFLLHYTGAETFTLPPLSTLYGFIINGCIQMLVVSSVFVGNVLVSPLFMSVGGALAIPTSVITDWLFNSVLLPVWAYVGIGTIFLGFIAFNVAEYLASRAAAVAPPATPETPQSIVRGAGGQVEEGLISASSLISAAEGIQRRKYHEDEDDDDSDDAFGGEGIGSGDASGPDIP